MSFLSHKGSAYLRFCSPQPDTSRTCKSTDTGPVCHVECLFSSQYQFMLLGKQRHILVNNLPGVITWSGAAGARTCNLSVASPMPWPLRHHATLILVINTNCLVSCCHQESLNCTCRYHVKYMFVGDGVKTEVEKVIRSLRPALQLRLRFISHHGRDDVTPASQPSSSSPAVTSVTYNSSSHSVDKTSDITAGRWWMPAVYSGVVMQGMLGYVAIYSWGCGASNCTNYLINWLTDTVIFHVKYSTLNNTVTLKSGLEVTQCHWKWCHSKAWVQFPICLLHVCRSICCILDLYVMLSWGDAEAEYHQQLAIKRHLFDMKSIHSSYVVIIRSSWPNIVVTT